MDTTVESHWAVNHLLTAFEPVNIVFTRQPIATSLARCVLAGSNVGLMKPTLPSLLFNDFLACTLRNENYSVHEWSCSLSVCVSERVCVTTPSVTALMCVWILLYRKSSVLVNEIRLARNVSPGNNFRVRASGKLGWIYRGEVPAAGPPPKLASLTSTVVWEGRTVSGSDRCPDHSPEEVRQLDGVLITSTEETVPKKLAQSAIRSVQLI